MLRGVTDRRKFNTISHWCTFRLFPLFCFFFFWVIFFFFFFGPLSVSGIQLSTSWEYFPRFSRGLAWSSPLCGPSATPWRGCTPRLGLHRTSVLLPVPLPSDKPRCVWLCVMALPARVPRAKPCSRHWDFMRSNLSPSLPNGDGLMCLSWMYPDTSWHELYLQPLSYRGGYILRGKSCPALSFVSEAWVLGRASWWPHSCLHVGGWDDLPECWKVRGASQGLTHLLGSFREAVSKMCFWWLGLVIYSEVQPTGAPCHCDVSRYLESFVLWS